MKILLRTLFLPMLLVVACSDKPSAEPKPSVLTERPQEGLPELTLFLAGKHPVDESRYGKLAKTPGYAQYKKQIEGIWSTYSKDFTAPLTDWRNQNVREVNWDVVFYPFAGPDFPNANTIYPRGKTYIMVGLEPAGTIPDFEKMSDKKVMAELNRMLASVDYVSRRTYFITSFMNQGYIITEGVAPVLLMYLGMLDYIPYSVKSIDLNEKGEIKYLTPEDLKQYKAAKKWPSVEVKYQAAVGEPLKTIYYFKQDVGDEALEKDPRLLTYLNSLPDYASVFKAASYLIHYETFSKIAGLVLNKSQIIVMDDTGPRVKTLAPRFDLQVFGRYGRPIYPFQSQYQNDLVKLYKEQKPEPIKFRYGYGGADGSRGIILATRKSAPANLKPEAKAE
ncbi:MAG: hypothetical protein JNM27_03765 [Leptospirales bacterium]|nr:hypothetical protein [Leptospirales bacterium]